MSKFNEAMIDGLLERISQIEPKASSTERAMDKVRQKLISDMPAKTGIFQGSFAKMAIAAAVIVAVGIAIALLINSSKRGTVPTPPPIVKEDQPPEILEPAMPTIAEQLVKLEGLYASGDVDGLMAALNSEEASVAVASAGFLGQIGDERAIDALSNLAAKWRGATENPFQKAIDSITKRIDGEDTPPETGKPDEIAAEPVAEPVEPNAAIAGETVREYEEPQNIHIIYTQVRFDGTSVTAEMWLRMPDHLHESYPDRILVDNGVDRLTLNVQDKTALFEDSWMDTEPLSKHRMLGTMNTFRGEMPKEVTCTKNEKESSAKIIVYDLEFNSSTSGIGKAWVNAETMLPNRIEAEIGQDPNNPNPQGTESFIGIYDYSPIPDSVFSMDVPKDYTVLPRKEAEAFTGQVVDEMGEPIAGAQVFVRTWALQEQMTGVTNSEGFFTVNPPRNQGLLTPVAIWAVIPGDDKRIAWTLLLSDDEISHGKGRALVGEIPGDPGQFDGTKRQLEKANGIVLQMEKAGRIFGQVANVLGEPLADAEVKIQFGIFDKFGNERIDSYFLWPTTAKTDENGYYVVGNLPRLWKKTKRRIRVSAADHISKWIKKESDGPLDDMQADFELLLSGITVRGTVHDNYGKPLDERQVSVSTGKGNTSIGSRTDKNGRFKITDCAIANKLTVTAELNFNTYSHNDAKKRATYVYYPDVSAEIVFEEDKFEYEVELIAELPELTVEVYVVDSAGDSLPFYPVELRSWGRVHLSREWKTDRNLHIRTDENGYCKLTGVPNITQMKLVSWPGQSVPSDKKLDEENQKLMREVQDEYNKKYDWKDVPVEIVEGVKDYEITAVVLTKEEAEEERKRLKNLKQGQP